MSNFDPIDDDLTVRVHALGSFRGDGIAYADVREDGSINNVSATPLWFEIYPSNFRKALPANGADPLGRTFPNITTAEVPALPANGKWAIFDESDGHKVFVIGGAFEKFS